MSHVADRILAAVKTRLAAVPGVLGVHLQPLHTLAADQLPAIVIDEIADAIDERLGFYPSSQTRHLSFVVKVCQMATAASYHAALGNLHEATVLALFGTPAAASLDGLLTRGLVEQSAELITDADSIDKPVGYWAITVNCIYNLRSDQPGQTEKELS